MISRRWEPAGVALAGFLVFLSLILWLDNLHIGTLNGLFKSLDLEAWISTPGTARLDYSNYIYFPVYASLCRFLDWIGVWRGEAWRQLAVLNAAFASLALATVYALIRDLTGRRDIAALATLFHLGCGFFLLLAVINEDIMPGYTLVLASMALAAARFDRPTPRAVIGVGILFALGWLFEWRLMFPTLPALFAAIGLAEVSGKRRLAMAVLLLGAILATAGLVVLYWQGHNGALGLPDVIWTGKGVATGWAGFSLGKFELLILGMGQYLLGGQNILIPISLFPSNVETCVSIALQLTALVYALQALWRNWGDARLRVTLAVFLGTFFAGEVMNAYAQPQDPQMQINVMPWLTVVWALALARTLLPNFNGREARAHYLVLLVLSVLPLLYNFTRFSEARGGDAAAKAAVAGIDGKIDLSHTIFLYWGFEPITGWQYFYDGRRWDGLADLGAAPDATPRAKWLNIIRSPLVYPDRTGAENAAALEKDIDWAFDNGYRVVAGDFWDWSADKLSRALVTVSGYASGPAIHAMLHNDYAAEPLFDQPGVGKYYALTRLKPNPSH